MLLLSSFRGNQLLAMVMVAVAALAWLADVVLRPALLIAFGSSARAR